MNEDDNPQNYQGDGDGGSKHQKDEDTEKNASADGNNGNGDENDGGGKEVGAEDGKNEKKSMTFCCQSDSTFTNFPNLDQSIIRTLPKIFSL